MTTRIAMSAFSENLILSLTRLIYEAAADQKPWPFGKREIARRQLYCPRFQESRRNGLPEPYSIPPCDGHVRGQTSALVFVAEVRERGCRTAVREQFSGFTSAEARLESALVAGKTLRKVCGGRRRQPQHGAHSLEEDLLQGWELSRQPELVRVLTTIPYIKGDNGKDKPQ